MHLQGPLSTPTHFPKFSLKDLTPSASSSDIQGSWDARRGADTRKPAFISSYPSLGLGVGLGRVEREAVEGQVYRLDAMVTGGM